MQIIPKIISKKSAFYIILLCLAFLSKAQDSLTIQVYFLYGSSPAKGYKDKEPILFGGIHGGHVTIGIQNLVVGFVPNNGFHYINHKYNFCSTFHHQLKKEFVFDTVGNKYVTFEIPVSDSQFGQLKKILSDYIAHSPYDYAFLGMRCASATYDILSKIGIVEKRSNWGNIFSNFYPKKLRKKMFILAAKHNYKITYNAGRKSRKWEKD